MKTHPESATLTMEVGEDWPELRENVQRLCAPYDGAYWQQLEREQAYPEAFVKALGDAGSLAALIPEEYGGSGLPLRAASVILEEIHAALTAAPTTWELTAALTWSRPWDQVSGFMRRAAVAETLAHLVLLESRGRVARTSETPWRWEQR